MESVSKYRAALIAFLIAKNGLKCGGCGKQIDPGGLIRLKIEEGFQQDPENRITLRHSTCAGAGRPPEDRYVMLDDGPYFVKVGNVSGPRYLRNSETGKLELADE